MVSLFVVSDGVTFELSMYGDRHAPAVPAGCSRSAARMPVAAPAGSSSYMDHTGVGRIVIRRENDIAPASTASGSAVIRCRWMTSAAADVNSPGEVYDIADQDDRAAAMSTQASGGAPAWSACASSSWPVASSTQEHMVLVSIWSLANSSVSSGRNAWASSIYNGYSAVADR